MMIETIRSKYDSIAKLLHAPKRFIQFQTTPMHDGSPHIERHADEFHYVVTERGNEFERRTTKDTNEILYWLISDLTWSMASVYELEHRIPNQDFRRLLFQTHIELLEQVDHNWSNRKRLEYEQILSKYPFSDDE